VLWILVLLAIIAGSFTSNARTDAKLAYNLVENAKARALADAGINRAILALLQSGTEGLAGPKILYPTTLTPEPAEVEEDPIEPHWRRDGTTYRFPFGGGEILVSIQDEGGKIDLNAAPDGLLQGLLISVGVETGAAVALVDAIADFRDGDDLRRLNGAEADDYRAAGLAAGPNNRPFQAVEELRRVIGVTRALYDKLSPALTVHSGRPEIDPATAPQAALRALDGMTADEAEALAAARGLVARRPKTIFTLRAEAHTGGGGVYVREAVVKLGGDGGGQLFRIFAWKQGTRQGKTPTESSLPGE
jgi:general secretion pathway protein K